MVEAPRYTLKSFLLSVSGWKRAVLHLALQGSGFLSGGDSLAIVRISFGSQSAWFYRVKAIYMAILRLYLLFALSLSHQCTVEFSQGYLVGDTTKN